MPNWTRPDHRPLHRAPREGDTANQRDAQPQGPGSSASVGALSVVHNDYSPTYARPPISLLRMSQLLLQYIILQRQARFSASDFFSDATGADSFRPVSVKSVPFCEKRNLPPL